MLLLYKHLACIVGCKVATRIGNRKRRHRLLRHRAVDDAVAFRL